MSLSRQSRIRELLAVEETEADRRAEALEAETVIDAPPSRRSERETGRVLSILDELETKEGK